MESPEKKLESRQNIFFRRIQALVAASTILGLSACNKSSEKTHSPVNVSESTQTEAGKIIENFPEEIPGASEVFIEKKADAEKVLIIINQIHLNPIPDLSGNPSPADIYWQLDSVNEVQKNVETILVFLKEKYGVSKVSTEGVTEKDIKEMESGQFQNSPFNNAFDSLYEYLKSNWSNFPLTKEELVSKWSHLDSAPFEMKQAGRIELLPAEDENILARIDDESVGIFNNMYGVDGEGKIKKDDVPSEIREKWDLIFHEREEFVIRETLKSPDNVNVVVFGNAHDWKDNVNQNPENKIGLVIINPETKNSSFLTNILLNAGFTSTEGSWIEFYFRDFIENLEQKKEFDEVLFKTGEDELKRNTNNHKLSNERIEEVIRVILDRSAIELKK